MDELQKDDRWLERRRREMQPYLDHFAAKLYRVAVIMPAPKRIYHFKTGEWEIVYDTEWQRLIDKIEKEKDDCLKAQFPEFFRP